MAKLDPTFSTLAAAGVAAVMASLALNWAVTSARSDRPILASGSAHAADAPATSKPQWAASATGRVEPKDGEFRITAQAPGRITAVPAKVNQTVSAGDLLVVLDDDELQSKHVSAEAEALVREREREEEPAVKGPAQDRRDAEDALDVASRELFDARIALDTLSLADGTKPEALKAARDKVTAADKTVTDATSKLAEVNKNPDMPLPTRLESALTQARADVRQVETAIDRARVRAPADGTVLAVWAKVGETAMPSADAPLILFGDVSSLRVRAEVEERDIVKLKVGQRVVIRVDAYPDKDFEGTVTQLAPALGAPRITTRGPRRPNDVEVVEVLASLDGTPPLLTGMRVDVFFRNDATASAGDSAQPEVTATTTTPPARTR